MSPVSGKGTINVILQRVPPWVSLLTHTSASIKHHTPPDRNHLLSSHGLAVLAGLCKIQLVNSDLRQRKEEGAGEKPIMTISSINFTAGQKLPLVQAAHPSLSTGARSAPSSCFSFSRASGQC